MSIRVLGLSIWLFRRLAFARLQQIRFTLTGLWFSKKNARCNSDVFVHGLPNGYGWVGASHRLKEWTDRCVAVTNQEIDEIWRGVPGGTPIEISPRSGF